MINQQDVSELTWIDHKLRVDYWQVKEVPYTKLCSTKKILTVNGQFPGQTLKVYKGDTIHVNVRNRASQNITMHW